MTTVRAPDISIVTCSYNQRRFLEATLRSVVEQTGVQVEYIVVDGASTDGSAALIESYAPKLTSWVSEADRGQSEALNKGLKRATAPIVGWLCSDDVVLPGALARVVALFAERPDTDAIYGDALLIDADGRIVRPKREIDFHPWLLRDDHNYIPQPAMFWRRNLHERFGYLREDLHLTMDLELWLRFASKGCRVEHVPQFWAAMRCHDSQKVFTQTRALRQENLGLRRVYGGAWAEGPLGGVSAALARGSRVVLKALRGGYSRQCPPDLAQQIQRLHESGR
jgi:glycosyltransferase involved in cell wall biosynthesis